MNDQCFVTGGGRRRQGMTSEIPFLVLLLLHVVVILRVPSPAADKPRRMRDIDINDVASIETMAAEDVRKIAITKAIRAMTDKDVAVTKAVYRARLGTDVEFDRDKMAFVIARQFHTRDAAMDVILHIANPNDVSFVGLLAEPHSDVEGSKDKGYRVILKADFRTIFPGEKERAGISKAIAADDEVRPPEPKPTASTATQASAPIRPDTDDPIRGKLDKARGEFDAKAKELREELSADIERHAAMAERKGKKPAVAELMAERAAFDLKGELPKAVPMKKYLTAMQVAEDGMVRAYEEAIQAYATLAKTDAVGLVKKELGEFKKNMVTPPGSDVASPFQSNSVWANTDWVLTVVERKGETFRGVYKFGPNELAVTGTVKGNKVSWLGTDVRAINGGAGTDDHFGIITSGKSRYRIDFVWRSANGQSGKFTVYHKKSK